MVSKISQAFVKILSSTHYKRQVGNIGNYLGNVATLYIFRPNQFWEIERLFTN